MKKLRLARPLVNRVAAALLFAAGIATAHADMPPVQRQGEVEFVSGGIGIDESTSMKAAEKDYSLTLVFAQDMAGKNVYTADVPVTITDSKGHNVLETTTNGPYLLVNLPAGSYRISSTYNGKEQVRTATVDGKNPHSRVVFEWQ